MIPNELGITLAGIDKKNKEPARRSTSRVQSTRIPS
jgi:hypothetical protein